eukprot:2141095-Rhodomonas_salina.1
MRSRASRSRQLHKSISKSASGSTAARPAGRANSAFDEPNTPRTYIGIGRANQAKIAWPLTLEQTTWATLRPQTLCISNLTRRQHGNRSWDDLGAHRTKR